MYFTILYFPLQLCTALYSVMCSFLAIFNGVLFLIIGLTVFIWTYIFETEEAVLQGEIYFQKYRCKLHYLLFFAVLRCSVLYFILVYSRYEPGLGIWVGLVWDMEMSRCPGINSLHPQPLCDICRSLLGDHRSIRLSNQNEWKVKTFLKI